MAKTTEINQAIGYAIKEGLARKHMTQSELAGIVGFTQRSISSYVTGNTQPPLDILTHICLTLEINMNQILLIPEFHNPHRIVKEKDELEYMALLDGLNACGKKDFIQTAKQIRKLIK